MKRILFIYYWVCFYQLIATAQQATFYYEILSIEEGMPSNVVYCVLQDQKGYIWAGTAKGVVRYDGETLESYSTEDGLTDNEVFSMKEAPNGDLYFSTFSGGISYYNGEHFSPHPQNTAITELMQSNWINSWAVDSLGGILFSITNYAKNYSDDRNLYYVNRDTLYIKNEINCPDCTIKNLHITENNELLVAGAEHRPKKLTRDFILTGLKRVSFIDDSTLIGCNNQKVHIIGIKNNVHYYMQYPNVFYGFKDKQGALWVGTNEGVYYFSDGKLSKEKEELLFKDIQVNYSCTDTEGNLWLTTLNKGLLRIPSLDIAQIPIENVKRLFCVAGRIYIQEYNDISALDDLSEQYSYANFFLQDFKTHTIKKNYKQLGVARVKDAFWNTEDSTLWLATITGVLTLKNGEILKNTKSFGYRTWCTSIAKQADTIYIGTRDGLHIWDLTTDKISKKEVPRLTTTIEDIAVLPNGAVVLGTNGQGLFFKEPTVDTFQHLSQKEGVPSNFVQVLEGVEDKLLVGTNRGLGIYFYTTKKWKYLTSKNGLVSNDITSLTHYNKEVWVATLNGITKIDSNYWSSTSFSTNMDIPVVLQAVNIAGKTQKDTSYYKVAPHEHNISIHFKAITFGDRPFYRYRLLGIHKNWQHTSVPKLQFDQFSPGSYQLEVAARLPGEEWGATQKLLILEIVPHYTQTWWFTVVWICLVLLTIVLIGGLILKGIAQRANTQLQIKKLEQKALRSQMNPHFLFNTMNSIQYLITTDQKKTARKYISKLSTLLRRVLQYSEYNLIQIGKEIETLKLYLDIEAMRYHNHVSIQLDIAAQIPTYFKIPPMLLQPMLENALVHGLAPKEGHGHLLLKMQVLHEQILEITIIDDGIGRKAAQAINKQKKHIHIEKVSVGLANIEKRIENLNKIHKGFITFDVTDNKPNAAVPGTKIVLKLNQTKLN